MRPLILDEQIQKHIDAAVARAKLHPLPISEAELLAVKHLQDLPDDGEVKLTERPPGWQRGVASERVLIPFGFEAAISFEVQPEPLGLCAHLSVSVEQPGRVPHPIAMEMLAKAFGMQYTENWPRRTWLEEFAPGHHAVNVVEPVEWNAKS